MLKIRYSEDLIPEIGFDEAGRGCFFGPIMAGAVCLPAMDSWPEDFIKIASKIKDSKKITPKRRKEYFDIICKYFKGHIGIGSVGADEINENGIQWANREAFSRALGSLMENQVLSIDASYRFLVDGEISFTANRELSCEVAEEKLIIEGDGTYLAIAMASILAKVSHDLWIEKWCDEHKTLAERYAMASCKGYGTAPHRNGLKQWGGCDGHRTLFIRNWIPGSNHIEKSKKMPLKKDGILEKCLIRFTVDDQITHHDT